jgi:hydroxypyruvate reductase
MTARQELSTIAQDIFLKTLAACRVEQAFAAKLKPVEGRPFAFRLAGGAGQPQAEIDLEGVRRVLVIAAGKGAATMLQGLLSGLSVPPGCALSGVLVAPERPAHLPGGVEYFAGGHPLPAAESFAAARAALALIRGAAQEAMRVPTFCFFLISGGASAMMELPLDEAISLEETRIFHKALVHSGASIAEINCVRKHFSAIKGGRLGVAAKDIPSLTVLVSDVPSGQLDALASGPTLPDSSTLQECRAVLDRFDLKSRLPASIRRFFDAPDIPETPKPGSFPTRFITLLSSDDLAIAARLAAESMDFQSIIDDSCDDWDYRPAAEHLLGRLRSLRKRYSKLCLIVPGEVTVTLPAEVTTAAKPNVGGRNQHFALYAATLLQSDERDVVIFSAGSDGIDGNSPYAGACVNYASCHDGGRLDAAKDALLRFDSTTLLESIGATIRTGPTGNNLRDLRLFLSG